MRQTERHERRPGRRPAWATVAALVATGAMASVATGETRAVSTAAAAQPYLGVIEGFYGAPWSQADRLSIVRWLGRHGMNTYVYAPKDDPYQRAAWREPYPSQQEAEFRALIALARASRVAFVYSISPGLDMCYSSPGERDSLMAKLGQLQAAGAVDFMVAFDDIPRTFHCAEDALAYGDGDAALGRAHADLANTVLVGIRGWDPAGRLIVVPSDYAERVSTPYLASLKSGLDPAVDLVWTGPFTVPSRISAAQADAVASFYGRQPVLWDNYPVNDYARERLHLGPVRGRAPNLVLHLRGFLANPMNEAEASKIPLYTLGEYFRKRAAYRPVPAWVRAVAELAGSRKKSAPLRRFAENLQSTATLDDPVPVWGRESTLLWTRIGAATRALTQPFAGRALAALDRELRLEAGARPELRSALRGRRLLTDIEPWLAKLVLNARAGSAAVRATRATRPAFEGVRVRRWGSRYVVSGRIAKPTRRAIDQATSTLVSAWRAAERAPKETHGSAIRFLAGMALSRAECTPGPLSVLLDGKPVRTTADGRFLGVSTRPAGTLVARDRHGVVAGIRLRARPRADQGNLARRARLARDQVTAVLRTLAAAVRREDVAALSRIYDPSFAASDGSRYEDAIARWTRVFASSEISFASFPLAAFDLGGAPCGGAVVAAVPWVLAGWFPAGIPYGESGATIGARAVFLLKNRGRRGAPRWRIVYAAPPPRDL